MDIQGISAMVAGGASRLGGATATALATSGAKATIFDVNKDAGEALAAAIGGTFAYVDVSDADAVTTAIAAAKERNGIARVLVNCAGITEDTKNI